jgi:hypothetical protein
LPEVVVVQLNMVVVLVLVVLFIIQHSAFLQELIL